MRSFSNQNLDRLKKWWVPFSISVEQRCYLKLGAEKIVKHLCPTKGWGIVPTFIFRIILTQWPQLNNKSKLMSPINWLPKLIKSHNPCLLGRYKLLLCPWGKEEKFNLFWGSRLWETHEYKALETIELLRLDVTQLQISDICHVINENIKHKTCLYLLVHSNMTSNHNNVCSDSEVTTYNVKI